MLITVYGFGAVGNVIGLRNPFGWGAGDRRLGDGGK